MGLMNIRFDAGFCCRGSGIEVSCHTHMAQWLSAILNVIQPYLGLLGNSGFSLTPQVGGEWFPVVAVDQI